MLCKHMPPRRRLPNDPAFRVSVIPATSSQVSPASSLLNSAAGSAPAINNVRFVRLGPGVTCQRRLTLMFVIGNYHAGLAVRFCQVAPRSSLRWISDPNTGSFLTTQSLPSPRSSYTT